jgi:hypothetical protein
MDIQLTPPQFAVFWNVLLGSPLGQASTITLSFGSNLVSVVTIGDLGALDETLKAAKVLGYSGRLLDQIQSKIDREVVAFGEALPKAA